MRIEEAAEMLKTPIFKTEENQLWADLGCGQGVFTLALASSLPAGSSIYAVDANKTALSKIPELYQGIHIKRITADFDDSTFELKELSGILMANSLHFIRQQKNLIGWLKNFLIPGGVFMIVEYDSDRSNAWVPYPVSFVRLNELFMEAGFSRVEKIKERRSIYQRANLYSALIY